MRREPYKISSGLLTLAVHVLLFGMLYLGVNWRTEQSEGMQVELWGQLPETQPIPAQAAPPPAPPPAPAKPEPVKPKETVKPAPPVKAVIEMPGKKIKPEPSKPKEPVKPEPRKKMSKAEQQRAAEDLKAMEQQEQQDLSTREAREAQAAKAAAAISSEQEKYMGLISAKIRRNIVMPPDLAEKVEAQFVITLLPDGSLVTDPKMVKSSGNAAYDAAVLRAILKAQPFPLPENPDVRIRFLNPNQIRLKFNSRDEQ